MPDKDVMRMPEWLAGKTWLECQVELCNTWAERGSEHPLFIFDAILKFASHLGQEWPTFLFRPERKFASVVSLGHHYRFTLVFPDCTDPAVMKSAIVALQNWLSRDRSHFALVSHGPVTVQTGQKIWDELLGKYPGIARAPGIRLELISPLPYENKDHGFKGAIDAKRLVDMLLRRVERLFGAMPASQRQDLLDSVPELRLWPWYWSYSVSQHKAKSQSGVRYLNGFEGPLWLSGPFMRILPLVVMASHLNLGSRLSAGQGALSVSPARQFLSDTLFEDSFWMRVWEDLGQNEPALVYDLPEGVFERLCDRRLDLPPGKWAKAGTHLDDLLGLGLFSLLSSPLARADEKSWKKWLDVLPVMPEDQDSLKSILDIVPPGDELLREIIFGFHSLCLPSKGERAVEANPESQDLKKFAPLRRPCIIAHPGAAVSLARGRIEARYDSQSLGNVPLGHVSALVLQGSGSVSIPLMRACAAREIPVVFCSQSGHFSSMVMPDSAAWRARGDSQLRHWDALGQGGRTRVAAALVRAKVRNYMAWLCNSRMNDPDLEKQGERTLEALDNATGHDSILGLEGQFARACFCRITAMLPQGWNAHGRVPHKRPDPWNCLLDTVHSYLFTKLTVSLHCEGLSPFRGYLHLQHERYPTLAADIQEIFRARFERWLVEMVKKAIFGLDMVKKQSALSWGMTAEGRKKLLAKLEQELNRQRQAEDPTLAKVMEEQVRRFRLWCTGKAPLTLFVFGRWRTDRMDRPRLTDS